MNTSFKILLMALLATSLCSADNVSDHLVGVHGSSASISFPGIKGNILPGIKTQSANGSGICIDKNCSVVATPYHVQALARRATLTIGSGDTDKVLSLASDSDPNMAEIPYANSKRTIFFDIAKDISFVYTKKPVPHKSGVSFSYKRYVGQKVQVAGYYKHKFESREARIIGTNVHLILGDAKLDENLILDIALNPGNSGSAVFDEQENLLGMITCTGTLKVYGGDLTASIALPVRTIAQALVKLDPVLGPAIFKDIPDKEPEPTQMHNVIYQDSDLPEDTSPVIPELSPVHSDLANAVDKLRIKARVTSALISDLIATQCLVQGTQKPICHEVAFVDGQQVFRKINKNGKLGKPVDFFPIQKHGVWVQSDWADQLGDIAEDPLVFRGSVDDHYLFTLNAPADDERCGFEEYPQGVPLFSGWHPNWDGSVACFKEVLTDKNFNVLSIFVELHPPDTCLTRAFQTATYYGWIELEGTKPPVLLPVKERVTAKMLGHKDLEYATLTWTDYKKFRAVHTIRFEGQTLR